MKLMAFAFLLLSLATSVHGFLPLQKKCHVLTGLASKYTGRSFERYIGYDFDRFNHEFSTIAKFVLPQWDTFLMDSLPNSGSE